MRRDDTLVIGGGMAGLPLALRAAGHRRTTESSAMIADGPYSDIGRAIHVHPTLAEGVNAAGGVHRPSRD